MQESVSNAVRHGQPSCIAICIAVQDADGLCVRVTDDGAGLGPVPSPAGMGLAGMAERVSALKGRFEIVANAGGRGVSARAVLPLDTLRARQPEGVS